MSIINIVLLIIVPFLNLVIGFWIIKMNSKLASNVFFGLLCISAAFWTLGMGLLHFLTDFYILEVYILKLTVIFSALIPMFYLMFATAYPFETKIFSRRLYLITIPLIIIILVALDYFRVENIYFEQGRLIEQVVFKNYVIFAIYFFSYLALGFYFLIKKYFTLASIYKKNVKYILFSTLITFLVVTFLSIILPLVNKYFYDWYSPIFTLINFTVIAYLIFCKPKNSG